MSGITRVKNQSWRGRFFGFSEAVLLAIIVGSIAQYVSTGSVTWVTQSFRWIESTSESFIDNPQATVTEIGDALSDFTSTIGDSIPDLSDSIKESATEQIPSNIPIELYKVVKVVDGDTIHIRTDNGTEKIRLHGIDAPESRQPYGRASRKALAALVAGENVRVIRIELDQYGRTVGKIYKDDIYINLEMVKLGYAWWYQRYAAYEFTFRAAQAEAQAQNLGLWADRQPMEPWNWRRR